MGTYIAKEIGATCQENYIDVTYLYKLRIIATGIFS